MVGSPIPVSRVGWKAADALAATHGRARILAPLSTSVYLTAGDEMICLGSPGSVAHPRMMLTRRTWLMAFSRNEAITIDLRHASPWPARRIPRAIAPSRLADSTRTLLTVLREQRDQVPAPRGLGMLLVGQHPPFPLDRAASIIARLARDCDANRVAAAAAAAEELLGLGPGLTPSGDDFVGGLLFSRTRVGMVGSMEWRLAAAILVERARQRTNPISATLLADLADGHAHAPLHDLADALDGGVEDHHVIDALPPLVSLGHSSGWDLLAGFLVGTAGFGALGQP